MFISCNDFLKASIIFKGSALHSFASSQEVWYNGGQNGQRRCPPPDTHTHTRGGSRGSHEVVLNDMSRVLKRWRLSCFTVWIWNANMFHFADQSPPCECRPRRHCVCMSLSLFFFKAPFKNTQHLRHDRNVTVWVHVPNWEGGKSRGDNCGRIPSAVQYKLVGSNRFWALMR